MRLGLGLGYPELRYVHRAPLLVVPRAVGGLEVLVRARGRARGRLRARSCGERCGRGRGVGGARRVAWMNVALDELISTA